MTSSDLTAKNIAEYFILKGMEDNKPITNKKLQKLLYYSQAWSLVLRNNEQLFGDKIEAWVHGPAIRSIYTEYKKFGFDPIKKDCDSNLINSIPDDIKKFLDQVWTSYGKYDAQYLEYLSHSETPWQKAREGIEPHIGSEKEISLDDMRVFYGGKLKSQETT